MSRSDPLGSLISYGLAAILIFVVLPVVLGIAGIVYVVNTVTLELLPKAEITRDQKGVFVVNSSNYDQWHTYATVGTSSNMVARLDGDFVLRAFPEVKETCHNIKNCQNYESKFVTLDYSDADVYLIKRLEDSVFSEAVNTLIRRIDKHHNELVGNYGLSMSFSDEDDLAAVERRLTLLEKVTPVSVDETKPKRNKVAHNNTLTFAKRNCRNNASGCQVNAKLDYSNAVFGGPTFSLSR